MNALVTNFAHAQLIAVRLMQDYQADLAAEQKPEPVSADPVCLYCQKPGNMYDSDECFECRGERLADAELFARGIV